ncbi:hypothetical protein [Actinophytocola sp.]|uniref:hypothetical protein n=1 Tax=Actinophytocola sp. TaxID=1872138 RepID=UPI00389B2E54
MMTPPPAPNTSTMPAPGSTSCGTTVSTESPSDLLIDDPKTLRQILTNADALLLNFDGPIRSVFAAIPTATVADQFHEVLTEGSYTDLPDAVRTDDGPFDVPFYLCD